VGRGPERARDRLLDAEDERVVAREQADLALAAAPPPPPTVRRGGVGRAPRSPDCGRLSLHTFDE
jgi:hypothetical protein